MRERERERERETICLGVFRAREAGLIQRRLLVKIGPTYLAHVSLGLESLPATYINARNNSEAPPHPYTYKMYIYIMCVCVCIYIHIYIYWCGTREHSGAGLGGIQGARGRRGRRGRRSGEKYFSSLEQHLSAMQQRGTPQELPPPPQRVQKRQQNRL